MVDLEEAYELIKEWGLARSDFVAQKCRPHLSGNYVSDNSVESAGYFDDCLQTIVDIGLKEAKNFLGKAESKTKCLYCDSILKNSPNKHWWVKKTYNEGICYRCILSLAKSVLVAMERTGNS